MKAKASSLPDTSNVALHPDTTGVTRQQISELAYQRFCNRGRIDGNDHNDWLEAEHQLLAEKAITSRAARAKEPSPQAVDRSHQAL